MRWLLSLFRRNRLEQELDEELQFHLEQAIEFGIARGLDPDQARREVMRSLEGLEQCKEECRDSWGIRAIDNLFQDVRYALRTLRKSPGFTIVAVLSLALGIGANTAVFSLMDVLLIRPLPVPQPEQLSLLSVRNPSFRDQYSFSYPLFRQIQERNSVYSGVFAWMSRSVQTIEASGVTVLRGVFASGDYFATLGVHPALGRVFGSDDDDPAGGKNGRVAVISDSFWKRRYAGNRSIVGKSLTINGVSMAIIGVMPPGFFGAEVGTAPDVWIPLNVARQTGDEASCFSESFCWFISIMARLRPGITETQAETNLRLISRPSMETTLYSGLRPDRKAAYLAQTVRSEPGESGFTSLRRRVANPLQVLMGLVALVLFIACANLANLLTARASARFREVGVRLALGAGRARVIRQFLTESILLAIFGAAAGLLFAMWSTRVLIGIFSTAGNPVFLDLHPDWRLLLFGATVSLLTGVGFGFGPALYATRFGATTALKDRVRGIRGGEARLGFGRVLLGIQVAFSVVLVAAAGLFAGTLVRLLRVDTGFDPKDLIIITIWNSYPPLLPPRANQVYDRLARRARMIPGVESATLLWPAPLGNGSWDSIFQIPNSDLPDQERLADVAVVGTQFTHTMRIPLLAGRDFDQRDTAQSEKVALRSENAARR